MQFTEKLIRVKWYSPPGVAWRARPVPGVLATSILVPGAADRHPIQRQLSRFGNGWRRRVPLLCAALPAREGEQRRGCHPVL